MIPYMIPWLSSRDPISGECHPSSRPWDISTAAHTRPPLSPGKDPRQNSRNLEGAGDGKAQHQSAIRCSRHRSKCQEAATDAPPARLTFGESEEKGCLTFERAVCCPQSPARQCTATLSLERCLERPASSLVKQLANTGPAL